MKSSLKLHNRTIFIPAEIYYEWILPAIGPDPSFFGEGVYLEFYNFSDEGVNLKVLATEKIEAAIVIAEIKALINSVTALSNVALTFKKDN